MLLRNPSARAIRIVMLILGKAMKFNAAKSHWQSETRICPACEPEVGPQSLDNFYIDRNRPNGKSNQCRPCTRRNTNQRRNLIRRGQAFRKPNIQAKPVWAMNLSPQDAVMLAIKRGADTQREIGLATKLDLDVIGEALAWNMERLDRALLRRRVYRAA